jgi:hypothetical protein
MCKLGRRWLLSWYVMYAFQAVFLFMILCCGYLSASCTYNSFLILGAFLCFLCVLVKTDLRVFLGGCDNDCR